MFDRAPKDNTLRRAMNACLPGLENRPDFERKVLKRVSGEVEVKKKLSVGFVLAILFVLMFATLAAAITLNLFEKYGQTDQRLMIIAPRTTISPMTTTIPNEAMGPSTVSITNGYYDGSSLLFGYTIENPEHIDRFFPTNEQMKKMQPTDSSYAFHPSNETERLLEEEYRKAQENGSPFGVVKFQVSLSPDTYSDHGMNLGTWTEFNGYSTQSLYASIRDFDTLPEEACGLESLSISTAIYQSQWYFYFDGSASYVMETQIELPPITTTIPFTQSEVSHYSGSAKDCGTDMNCVVEATDMRLSARVSGLGLVSSLPEGCYYDMCLKDAEGNFIEASTSDIQDDNVILFTFYGTGSMPELQTASLLIVGDEQGTTAVHFSLSKE